MSYIFGILFIFLIVLGVAAIVVRNVAPPEERKLRPDRMPAAGDHPEQGGHTAVRAVDDPTAALAALDATALATPRTERIAGSVEEGHVVYVTRSRGMGFPDVSHAWSEGDLVAVRGGLVLGKADMGVNRKRITGWLEAAGIHGSRSQD